MNFEINDLIGEHEVLSGARMGRLLVGNLLAKLGPEPKVATPLVLDFRGVQYATSSFLREAVVGLRNFLRDRESNFFLLVGNANIEIQEELGGLLDDHADAVLVCELGRKRQPQNVHPLGRLEGVQQRTFDLVLRHGDTSAVDLCRLHPEDRVAATAWNNRLTSLWEKRLVVETQLGRSKRYRPVVMEA